MAREHLILVKLSASEATPVESNFVEQLTALVCTAANVDSLTQLAMMVLTAQRSYTLAKRHAQRTK